MAIQPCRQLPIVLLLACLTGWAGGESAHVLAAPLSPPSSESDPFYGRSGRAAADFSDSQNINSGQDDSFLHTATRLDPIPPPVEEANEWGSEPVFRNPNTVELPLSVMDGTYYGVPSFGPRQTDDWGFHLLPESLIYRSYLAGPKESRMSGHLVNIAGDGWIWDSTLGARIGLFRYGSGDGPMPQGFQVDVEGSAQVRLDVEEEVDVRAVDFRAGIPLTYGWGNHQTKLAYYHLSSHLGDEFLLKNPGFNRLNFARDVVVLGHSIYLPYDWRIYGEVGYAFYNQVADQWEFQFGAEYAPMCPTGIHGAPFFATNVHLREEVDFGGTFNAQAGWAWRGDAGNRLLRIGVQFQAGKSNENSFYNDSERQIGLGVWYDF